MGIYTSKFRFEAPCLMKYGEVVHDLASHGGDWSFNDTQFRCLKQLHPNEMLWGSTHWEPWIKAQNFGNSKPKIPRGKPPRFASLGIPKGFCHKFHKGLECHGCKYKHTCYKCNLSHSATCCNFRSPPATSPQGTPLPGPELPTPVQIEHLLPLLHGYDVDLVHALCNVLNLVFPFIFKGRFIFNYSVAVATSLTRKSSSFNRLCVYLILMYVHRNELLHGVQFRSRVACYTSHDLYKEVHRP